ncbi:HAD family hydrolase [Wenyingzhuangia sp. IMCC45533]
MSLADVKLIVTDMDGTLLDANHEVSSLFFKQFELLKKHEIKFVAASGRQYHSILQKLKSIENDITIVAENGAYVVKNGKELFSNAFNREEALKFVKIAQQIPEVYLVLAGKKKAYYLDTDTELVKLVSEYYSEYELLKNFDTLPNDDILKLALYHPKGSEAYIYPHLEQFASDWQIKVSGEFWVDIALKTNHKGNAVARIQKALNISEKETMAFGDYQNDIEMLKKARYSYAMQNAHPDVLEIANYKTLSNDQNGVEAVIEKLLNQL